MNELENDLTTVESSAESKPKLAFIDDEQRILRSMKLLFRKTHDVFITTDPTEYIDYISEPARTEIVGTLIPRYISTKIYYALVESQTSEHAARMSAMENATSNCGEMVRYLTLVYNKRRQEGITNEMLDIVGGAEALRGQ